MYQSIEKHIWSQHRLTLIPGWISNDMSICVGCNYLSIPKIQRLHHLNLEMDKWFHTTLYNRLIYIENGIQVISC